MIDYTQVMRELCYCTGKLMVRPSVEAIGDMKVMHRDTEIAGSEELGYYYNNGVREINEKPQASKAVVRGKKIDVIFYVESNDFGMRPEAAFVNFDIYGGEGVEIETFEVSNNFSSYPYASPIEATWEAAMPNELHEFTNTTQNASQDWRPACHIVATCESGEMTLTAPLFVVGPGFSTYN